MMWDVSAFRLPGIDFDRIRPYGQPASRASAFEELASILIEQGVAEWPEGVRFERFGNPDGGREGRGILPNGNVWAWQAKYLRDFGPSAAAQVTSSVIRALDLEPNLKRYFVTLPIDRPAGDTMEGGTKKESAYTRWVRKVAEWQEAAREKGTEVEFVFIGAHELVAALTEPRHAGRVRYWFSADVLAAEWQEHRVEEAVARAGRRYSPALHVEVEAVRGLDAVGRTEAWTLRWRDVLAGLRTARSPGRERDPWEAAAGKVPDALARPFSRCIARLDEADAALAQMITATGSPGPAATG